MITISVIVALMIGLGAGIALGGSAVTEQAHLYCRNCTRQPLPYTITVATPTRSERRRMNKRRREMNQSLSDRVN